MLELSDHAELIDTQWDVNRIKWKEELGEKFRINRYIVGCKYTVQHNAVACKLELIDTQWDVNLHQKRPDKR